MGRIIQKSMYEHRVECMAQTGYAGAQSGMHNSNGVCRSTVWDAWFKRGMQEHRVDCMI